MGCEAGLGLDADRISHKSQFSLELIMHIVKISKDSLDYPKQIENNFSVIGRLPGLRLRTTSLTCTRIRAAKNIVQKPILGVHIRTHIMDKRSCLWPSVENYAGFHSSF